MTRQCKLADALPLYQLLHEQMPGYVPAQIGLARSLVAANRLPEAKPLVDDLVATRASSADAWAVRAEYLARSGQDGAAAWAEALRLAPTSASRKLIKNRREGLGCPSK